MCMCNVQFRLGTCNNIVQLVNIKCKAIKRYCAHAKNELRCNCTNKCQKNMEDVQWQPQEELMN